MAVLTKAELFQRMNSLIRSGGQGGKTKATEIREFVADLIDTIFSLFGQSSSAGGILEYDPEAIYDFTINPFAVFNFRIFKTKIDGQTGNEPPFSPDGEGNYEDDNWIEISPAPASGIAKWKAGVYTGELVIVYHNGSLYRLDVAPEAMPFESVDIALEEEWVIIGGGSGGSSTETAEFQAVTWAATTTISVPTGIKSHKVKIAIPSGSAVATGALAIAGDGNGVFCSGTIYNNDSVAKTINLPTGDLVGKDLTVPISLPATTALDVSFKNDGTKRIWQFSQTKTI